MDETTGSWSAPTECRVCRHPIPVGCEQCFRCQTPQDFLSSTSFKFLGKQLLKAGGKLLELSIHLVLIFGGLYFCFKISPLVTLFPLFIALSSRPQ